MMLTSPTALSVAEVNRCARLNEFYGDEQETKW
jgi:hypothetical protein